MSKENSAEDGIELDARTTLMYDGCTVAERLQEVYEHVLNDRQPEAVGSTERLAEQLGIELERPDRFPRRVRRSAFDK